MVGGLPGGDTRSEIPWVQGKKEQVRELVVTGRQMRQAAAIIT